MSLQSTAQMIEELMVEEPLVLDPAESGEHIVMYPEQPSSEIVIEMHDPEALEDMPMEVSEEHPGEIVLQLGELPGVDMLDPEMEKKLEVVEEPEDDSKAADVAQATTTPSKWDWQSRGAEGFVNWVKERFENVPSHSGYDTAGAERAIAYLDKLDSEISKAMRLDLDEELDHNKIESIRAEIEQGIDLLRERVSKISKKNKKKKKASGGDSLMVKEAQKIPGISGIVVTVPLEISSVVRTCINGSISAGHDIEDMFNKLSKKYNFTDRERMSALQLFADMGYPMRRDRGYETDEDVDPTSSDNFDWSASFQN